MTVLVLGGYGLIGQAVVERLLRDGVSVIGSGRRVAVARRRWPQAEWRAANLARLSDPAAWGPLLRGVEVVVNAAGLLQGGLGDDAARLQASAMPALYAQARVCGVRRIVQISAAGASPQASTSFMRHKAAADAALLASGVEAAVLRPGLVISPVAYGGTAMLRGLAALPWITPVVHGERPVQTVAVDELAEAVAAAVAGRIAAGSVVDLVEAESRSLMATVKLVRAWLGLPPAPVLVLPAALGTLVSMAADGLGWLGWRSPLRSTSMRVIRAGVIGDGAAAAAVLGRPLKTLPQTLAALPAGVQERWFARMWLLKALIMAMLSAFWIASGAVALIDLPGAHGRGGHGETTRNSAPLFPASTAEAVAIIREYADAGISHLQVWLDPGTVAGIDAFAPVLAALRDEGVTVSA